jgi:hypothetical protein
MRSFVVAAEVIMTLAAIVAVPCSAQFPGTPTGPRMNIPGTLELVDKPPAATPVEFLMVTIRQLHGGYRFDAQPDHDGNFTLREVPPGRYLLHLSFPCRIRSFVLGSRSLMPDDFELRAGESSPLRIVASLKTAVLSVDISGIPGNHPALFAVLYPADPYLMPPDSGIGNPVSGRETQYRFLTPGRYTLFVADEDFKWALTSPAVRNALEDKATAVQVRDDGETKVTTTYIAPDAVRQAITAANWKNPREMFDKQPGKAKQQ